MQSQARPKAVYIDNSVNSGYLDVSYHHLPAVNERSEPILKMKIPGDGNCGLYAIALGLMNLIAQDKLALSEEAYAEFLSYMLTDKYDRIIRARAQYYRDGIPLDDKRVRLEKCLPHMDRIIKAFRQNRLATFGQFKRFLLNYNSYYDVLALAICMGPALRDLSMHLLNKYPSISQIEGIPILEAEPRDGKDAPFAQLNLLAGFFDFHLIGYDHENKPLGGSYGEIQLTPAITPRQVNSAADNEEEKENVSFAEVHEELDPLLGLPINQKPASSSQNFTNKKTTSSSTSSTSDTINDEEKENSVQPLAHDGKPTLSIAYSNLVGHWDLLLPLSNYLCPPFYFGFDFVGVDFEPEALLAKQQLPPDLAATQISLAHEKKRMQQFRQELIKLKIAVSALSNKNEFEAGKKLIQVLESNLNTLFTPKNAPLENLKAQHNAFVVCSRVVRETHEKFKKNSPSVANILANIGLFIATLGIGYLVAGAIHYYATGRVGFFNKPPAILRNELPAFSSKLVELHNEKRSPLNKVQNSNTPIETVEDLPPLPAFKEWSKLRI